VPPLRAGCQDGPTLGREHRCRLRGGARRAPLRSSASLLTLGVPPTEFEDMLPAVEELVLPSHECRRSRLVTKTLPRASSSSRFAEARLLFLPLLAHPGLARVRAHSVPAPLRRGSTGGDGQAVGGAELFETSYRRDSPQQRLFTLAESGEGGWSKAPRHSPECVEGRLWNFTRYALSEVQKPNLACTVSRAPVLSEGKPYSSPHLRRSEQARVARVLR
jgi:hypothetical protein